MLRVAVVKAACALWSRHADVAAGWRRRALLRAAGCCLKCCQGGVRPLDWACGATARCLRGKLLEGAPVRVVCALWSGHFGAAAGFGCKVPLQCAD